MFTMKPTGKLSTSIALLTMATAGVLAIPLVAMQFTTEIIWTMSDFIFAGVLIFGTGLAYLLLTRTSGQVTYRLAVGCLLATTFLLLWVNGAVGIIGSENNNINLLYFGVLAIGLIGGTATKLTARGMELTLYAMIFGHSIIVITALILEIHKQPESSVFKIITVNAFFSVLWLVSAMLFRRFAAEESPQE